MEELTGGFTCPHCGQHSEADLEDVHPSIAVTCEHCKAEAVVTVMTVDAYVRHCEVERVWYFEGKEELAP